MRGEWCTAGPVPLTEACFAKTVSRAAYRLPAMQEVLPGLQSLRALHPSQEGKPYSTPPASGVGGPPGTLVCVPRDPAKPAPSLRRVCHSTLPTPNTEGPIGTPVSILRDPTKPTPLSGGCVAKTPDFTYQHRLPYIYIGKRDF